MDLEQILTETQTWGLTNFIEFEDIELYLNKVMLLGHDGHSALAFLYGQVTNEFRVGIEPELVLNYVPLYHEWAYGQRYH